MADKNRLFGDFDPDGSKHIDQYTKSFDSLRDSIQNLSTPISKLDDNITGLTNSLDKLNTQNQNVASSGNKVKEALDKISSTSTALEKVIDIVKTSFASLEGALTGGLTILIAFAPEIINFTKALFKGKDAIDQAKLSLNELNKGLSSTDYSKAIENVDTLKIKVDLAKKGFIQKSEVVKEYNKTLGQAIGQVKTLNQVETVLKNNAQDYIKMMLYKASAMATIKEAAENQVQAQKELHKSDEESIGYLDSGLANADDAGTKKEYHRIAERNREDAAKPYFKKANELLKLGEYFETKAAIFEQKLPVDKLNKQIAALKKTSETYKKDSSGNTGDHPDNTRHLEAMSVDFAQTIELEKENYDKEKALLDDQLNKKLISEQQYQEQSKQLQEKYHQNIGSSIKDFADTGLDQAWEKLQEYYKQNKQREEDEQKDKIKHIQELRDFELQTAQQVSNSAFSILQNSIKSQSTAKIKQLETQKDAELKNSSLTSSQKQAIEEKYKKKEADEKTKAFKAEQRASILQAVINGALAITKVTAQSGILGAFVIPGIIAETAIQVATIAAQKTPQYAKGGLHYKSDGKGALLPGYSRTDNTNAYLRSGEAVVVSEAMRDPWARNLVSAINVAYGGRDFSMSNPGRGYAIGGIFTDGGNSNRYYNQPMNDQKDLANTIAYQMINNFPPVYVDVKDINNQQNILAQTVNRVNL